MLKLARGNDGAGTLELQESFDRAWRRVGLALDRVGFATVEDRDRSKGLYFVRLTSIRKPMLRAEGNGFLLAARVLERRGAEGGKTKYRIYLKTHGAGLTTVQVLSPEGGVGEFISVEDAIAALL